MSIYRLRKTGSLVELLKAPDWTSPFSAVDPDPARAVHTYGSGALGFGGDDNPSKQTALTILYDVLADGPAALTATPGYTAVTLARWNVGSFTSSDSINKYLDRLPAPSSFVVAAYPYVRSATFAGETKDNPLVGQRCYAWQVIGDAPGDGTLDGFLEESDNGTDWNPIDGATFTQVPGSDSSQVIYFTSDKAKVRYSATLDGDSPEFSVAAMIGRVQ